MKDKYDITNAHAVKALGFTDFYGPDDALIFPEGVTPPTKNKIDAKLKELRDDFDSKAYARNRQQKFPNEHDLLVSLWEKVMEDRSESADALQAIRIQVKSDIPKP